MSSEELSYETLEASHAKVTTSALSFQPERVSIKPGESVTWEFSGTVHNVVFTDRAPSGGTFLTPSRVNRSPALFHRRVTTITSAPIMMGMKGRVRVE